MRVLVVHYGDDWLAGSEMALLEMIRHFDGEEVEIAALWCNAEPIAAAVAALGVPVVRDNFNLYFNYDSPPFSLRSYARLVRRAVRLIRDSKADLVHCNSAAPAQWMRLACWIAGAPMLSNVHSPHLKRGRYVMGVHLADRIVCVASAVARPILADGMDPSRVAVVHNGFDIDATLAGDAKGLRRSLGIPDDAVVVAIAGSLLRLKGHDLLFEALRKLDPAERPHLIVLGDGPELETYRRLAEGLAVHFLGRRNDIGAIFRDAVDFLVSPSRQEAFGRVIIEAAIGGIPAIGSNIDGIPEAIVDGETGLLTPPEDTDALAEAIRRLATDVSLRQRLGRAAKGRAVSQFAIGQCTERMRAQYQTMLDRHARERFGALRPARLKPYLRLRRRVGG